MQFDWRPREPDTSRARRYFQDGLWTDETLGRVLGDGLGGAPDAAFTVRSDRRPFRGTFAEVDAMARRAAREFQRRGIRPGDAVAFQLPNWVEAAVTFYAAAYVGAVVVPIVHFYGAKEVEYILRRTGVKAFVTTDHFGHVDFRANLAGFRSRLPELEWVAVVDAPPVDDEIEFSALLDADPIDAIVATDPNAPALIAYTSGTTSDPKGVVHVHRTINAEIRQLGAIQPRVPLLPAAPDAITGAPVGHGIGMLAALLLPVWRRRPVHIIDVWDPGRVLAAMLEDGLLAGQGATYFLMSLLDHPDFDPLRHAPLMTAIGLGGSAVPVAVAERARALGIQTTRSFGSTEHPSITGCDWDEPWEKRATTDGRAMPGVELRLVDESGHDVAAGLAGEIISQGPECFWGYTDPGLTAACFDGDGWFHTGDVGVLDADGYLTITDRVKDIIIRGGENVSAQEIEELVMRMADVAEVAVVAAPDLRLGEHACAFLRMQPGAEAPTMAAMQAHLDAAGLARQKWPEEIRTVAERATHDFPRTPSGKIQKFVLRAELRGEA